MIVTRTLYNPNSPKVYEIVFIHDNQKKISKRWDLIESIRISRNVVFEKNLKKNRNSSNEDKKCFGKKQRKKQKISQNTTAVYYKQNQWLLQIHYIVLRNQYPKCCINPFYFLKIQYKPKMAEKEQKKNADTLQTFLNQNKELNCPICYQFYNSKQKTPMMFCLRQHNLCSICSTNLLREKGPKCPICSIKIVKKNVKKNRLLTQIVEKIGQIIPVQNKHNGFLMITWPQQLDRSYIPQIIPLPESPINRVHHHRNRFNIQPFVEDLSVESEDDKNNKDEESQNDSQVCPQYLPEYKSQQSEVISQNQNSDQSEQNIQKYALPRKIRKI